MDAEGLWFSKLEREYSADLRQFSWTDEQRTWDWKNLTSVDLVRTRDGRRRLILRRRGEIHTRFGRPDKEVASGKDGPMGTGAEGEIDTGAALRYMLGIEIHDPPGDIETDYYTAKILDHQTNHWRLEGPKLRWSFKVGDEAWIWQWADERAGPSRYPLEAKIGEVHKYINDCYFEEGPIYANIFKLDVEKNDECLPVVYQPAVDGLKNFVREVHRSPKPIDGKKGEDGGREVEVTIVFNNEELRRHKWLNGIYEIVRSYLYGRIKDIETFVIMADSGSDKVNGLQFSKIYSGHHDLEEDTIHADQEDGLPPHRVRYYADDYSHPIIFINTSNHAMAEHDTNPDLWKWEYVPWLDDRPFALGRLSREEVNKSYKSLFKKASDRFGGDGQIR